MHPNGTDLITDQYILSPNKVLTMAATCGHAVMVHLRSTTQCHSRPRGYELGCIRRYDITVLGALIKTFKETWMA